MRIKDAVSFMGIFAGVCAVALASTLVARSIPPIPEKPSCELVETRAIPSGFHRLRGGVEWERAAYEVDVFECVGGQITVRK